MPIDSAEKRPHYVLIETNNAPEGKKMAARKQPNTAKAVAWTPTGRSEIEGPIAEVIYYTFMAVPRSQRDALLRRMNEWNNQPLPDKISQAE